MIHHDAARRIPAQEYFFRINFVLCVVRFYIVDSVNPILDRFLSRRFDVARRIEIGAAQGQVDERDSLLLGGLRLGYDFTNRRGLNTIQFYGLRGSLFGLPGSFSL